MKPNFYHGTSDAIRIKKLLLPPQETSIQREDWRIRHLDKVFFTSSLKSAAMYAKKACQKFGGNPIVYEIRPIGGYSNIANVEYISDKALVVRKI